MDCVSGDEYATHVWSSGHKAKAFSQLSDDRSFYCEVCDVQSPSQKDHESHLGGADHMLKQIRGDVQRKQGDGVVVRRGEHSFWCQVCQVDCTSMEVMDTHLLGKKHRRKVELAGLAPDDGSAAPGGGCGAAGAGFGTVAGRADGKRFRCEICQIETTDQGGLLAHQAGKKHRKKLEACRNGP